MTKILDGIDDILDRWLGIHGKEEFGTTPKDPQFKSKAAAIELSKNKGPLENSESPAEMIMSCMERLEANLDLIGTENVATSNWKWTKSLKLTSHNSSQEKTLEKLVAFLLSDDWVNQIPVCNGLAGRGASACRIDLGYRVEPTAYELIELKYADNSDGGSDYPLYAALEMLRYGMLYLLFRKHNLPQGRRSKSHHILSAKSIRLIVLAPSTWYRWERNGDQKSYALGWLESALTVGLQSYIDQDRSIELDAISFRFEELTAEFEDVYRPLGNAIKLFRSANVNPRREVFLNRE